MSCLAKREKIVCSHDGKLILKFRYVALTSIDLGYRLNAEFNNLLLYNSIDLTSSFYYLLYVSE
jgi:hypothetical protein